MQKPTGDAALIKKINSAIVLDCVLRHAPLSRAQISERTGLNKATVSSLVQELISGKLVVEIGMGESSGGRKPVMLLFNRSSGYAVGIELGVTYIRGMVADLEGHPVAEAYIELESRAADKVLPRLFECIEELIAKAPDSIYGIVGIGIGVPGIVDGSGAILFAPNLEWAHVPLQALVGERFGIPVTIDNEANAGAQGEQKYGVGRGIEHIIYVSAGIGIGTGIIIDRKLYKGASGFSGELGHLSIAIDGKRCSCGNQGCWELYASEKALLEQAAAYGWSTLDQVIRAAEDGSVRAAALLKRIGKYLGIGIANIVNVFNPDAVIIGNALSLTEPWIRESVLETIERRTLPYHRSGMKVLYAELRERSAVYGAAYYAISGFFDKVKGQA
ncbi:ROK family protein [Paenibacillus darwinianus]|uniref:ROK family protein n=1 Tax=Paenibacillus darwinianus TaxID=1380763 RepID=A0A9W5W779_9BACL|nr:ROK family transcriptional regulator [Paenibacillus darwinianus]EXX86536.1 ROK family protein [Paenibacillus darwinianus]EXX87273.1 ROK family protein [Paenibacillus darwinianus]EXX87362.1 ROK family protein [Paenibacillus darwinianus]